MLDLRFIYFIQIHWKIGNKVDGFYFWCIPNWDDRVHWQMFQLYMLIIIMILPTIIMTVSYSGISREILKLSQSQKNLER